MVAEPDVGAGGGRSSGSRPSLFRRVVALSFTVGRKQERRVMGQLRLCKEGQGRLGRSRH